MLDVLNNFMKNLFIVKSSDCNTLLSRLQTSRAYSRIGRHAQVYLCVCVAISRTLCIRASWSWYILKTENSLRCSSIGGRRCRKTPLISLSNKRCSQVCDEKYVATLANYNATFGVRSLCNEFLSRHFSIRCLRIVYAGPLTFFSSE